MGWPKLERSYLLKDYYLVFYCYESHVVHIFHKSHLDTRKFLLLLALEIHCELGQGLLYHTSEA